MSDQQVAMLSATRRPLVLMFDGDEAGQAGMRSAFERINGRASVRLVKLPLGKHPDDLSPAELAWFLS